MAELTWLSLAGNSFRGEIPTELAQLTNLEELCAFSPLVRLSDFFSLQPIEIRAIPQNKAPSIIIVSVEFLATKSLPFAISPLFCTHLAKTKGFRN